MAESTFSQTRIGGRYRPQRMLAEGGMGSVLRVLDEATGRVLALKRLRPDANARLLALFQREFYTLASLKHPSVVEAYEYGLESGTPYYTMELLDGGDLRANAPLPWREACRVLREVAAALGVLHARRLVHRDVSPSNVWRTPSGQIKLIDFGTLASFGIAEDVAGTPAFVPPEALYAQPLDARSDLYALGALGYWLISGQHAYPADVLTDLTQLWRSAQGTSQRREWRPIPGVPPALQALLASLLSLNPLARPGSHSELIEQLDAITTRSAVSVQSLGREPRLESHAFVGRIDVRDAFQRRLSHVHAGRGSALLIESAPGLGRTRLLQELSVEASLHGASVMHVAAKVDEGAYDAVRSFAHQLLNLRRSEARAAAAKHAQALARISRRLHGELGCGAYTPLTGSESTEERVCLQTALLEWFLEVAESTPLVLLVDDLHAMAEPSAAWLSALATRAAQRRLLVVATLSHEHALELGAPANRFRELAAPCDLPALSLAETTDLLRSVLGEVPNLSRLASRLQRTSRGSPAHCMELLEYLVRIDAVHCADGLWSIPAEIGGIDLPASRYEAQAIRLQNLPDSARAFGQVLAIHNGEVPLEACLVLFEGDAEQAFRALSALTSSGVLTGSPQGYRFSHASLRERLLGELEGTRRRRAHVRFGEFLLTRRPLSRQDALTAGVHLLRGGDFERGGSLVVSTARDTAGTDIHVSTALLLEEALELFRGAGSTDYEQIVLLSRLCAAGYYADRRFAVRHGDATLALFDSLFRLPLARRWRPRLGGRLSVMVAFAISAFAFARRRRNPLVPGFRDALRLLLEATTTLVGTHVVCVDPDAATRCAQTLEPMAVLGADHPVGFVHEYCMALAATVRDRLDEAWRTWHGIVTRLQTRQIRCLPSEACRRYLAGGLYALGVLESWRDDSRALSIADELDRLDGKLFAMSADRVRAMHYACHGKPFLAEYHRQRVEEHAIAEGSAWQVETWSAAASLTVALRTGDLLGTKRSLQDLEELRRELSSFDIYQYRAAGAYWLLRGDPQRSAEQLERCLDEVPLAVVGWARTRGSLARAYNELGEHARARQLCMETLAQVSDGDLTFAAQNLSVQIELALAEAGLGNLDLAVERLDGLLARFAPNRNPLTLGALHEARARVALLEGDYAAFERALREVRRWYVPTAIPALVRSCDRLAAEGRAYTARHPVSGTVSLGDEVEESSARERG